MHLIFPDHVPDRRCHHHDFKCRNLFSFHIWNQLLRHDSLQHRCQLNRDLSLLIRREYINDTIHCIGCSQGMQSGKDQMSGFCRCHDSIDRFIVSHLSQKNDIRALTQCRTKCGNIALRICHYLSLADNTFIMTMYEFQRILQCDDMFCSGMINMINHTGKGCGLATARRSGYQHQSIIKICQMDDLIRNPQLLWIRQLKCNYPNNSRKRSSLFISADTKSGQSGKGK